MFTIRNERPGDWEAVETLTRRAFYNQYIPGCMEHYLVHIMRGHEDFIPELDFVAELDGEIVGNIMYTRAWLTDAAGNEKPVLTFGPMCVAPEHQRQGYGKTLMEHSFEAARALGYDTVVIFGQSGKLCGPWICLLQKAPGECGGRQIPLCHAGEGAGARGTGGPGLDLPGQSGDGGFRGGRSGL